MRCLVTGGYGFIGSHVVAALREAEHETIILDINGDCDYQVNICNTVEVERAFRESQPKVVFHIAAIADARYALNDPVKAVQINLGGTVAVLEAARRAGVKRVILASTCWVANAMGSGILDESSPFNAVGGEHVYTTTKIASEMMAHDFHSLYGLNFTILRYGIPYGPGMWAGLVLRNWLDKASAGEPLVVYGDGSASRRFLYVKDLAQAHVLALQEVAKNQTYNLEGMRAITVRELADVFQRVWGPIEIEYRPEPSRIGEFQYMRKIISNAKAYVELGWEPTTDLEDGIKKTVNWYRSQIHQTAKEAQLGA
jgi:nucleoside-diphosphate-sugar epimerase